MGAEYIINIKLFPFRNGAVRAFADFLVTHMKLPPLVDGHERCYFFVVILSNILSINFRNTFFIEVSITVASGEFLVFYVGLFVNNPLILHFRIHYKFKLFRISLLWKTCFV